MGAMILQMDGRDQGRFGDSPCEDHGGLQRRWGKVPPSRALGKMVPACLPAFVLAAELGAVELRPPRPPPAGPDPGGGERRRVAALGKTVSHRPGERVLPLRWWQVS